MKNKILKIVILLSMLLIVGTVLYRVLPRSNSQPELSEIKVSSFDRSYSPINFNSFIIYMGVPTITDSKLEKFEAGEDAVMVAMASSRVPGGMFSSNTSTLPVVHDEETGRTRSMMTPESAEFSYDEEKDGCYYYVEIFVPEDTKWEMKELQLFNEYTQETYSYDSKISKLRSEKNGYREYLIGFHFPITSYSEKDFKVTAKTTINGVAIQKSETLVGISY